MISEMLQHTWQSQAIAQAELKLRIYTVDSILLFHYL